MTEEHICCPNCGKKIVDNVDGEEAITLKFNWAFVGEEAIQFLKNVRKNKKKLELIINVVPDE